MPSTRDNSSTVVAKEAIVINVGARPIEYQKSVVANRRTGDMVEVELHEFPPVDEGDEGIPYAFKQGQRVNKNHEAVKACPGAFVPADDWEGDTVA